MTRPNSNWNDDRTSRLTRGQRAADILRNGMGSWWFVGGFVAAMAVWAVVNTIGPAVWDPYPFILLNLFLSMLAGLQGASSSSRRSARMRSRRARRPRLPHERRREARDRRTDAHQPRAVGAAHRAARRHRSAEPRALTASAYDSSRGAPSRPAPAWASTDARRARTPREVGGSAPTSDSGARVAAGGSAAARSSAPVRASRYANPGRREPSSIRRRARPASAGRRGHPARARRRLRRRPPR